MVNYSYGELRRSYASLWKTMEIPPGIRVRATDARVAIITTGKSRYDQVANATGVPWYVIGMIHEMEGGLNFATHLHNGDPLTNRTIHVSADQLLAFHRSSVGAPSDREQRFRLIPSSQRSD